MFQVKDLDLAAQNRILQQTIKTKNKKKFNEKAKNIREVRIEDADSLTLEMLCSEEDFYQRDIEHTLLALIEMELAYEPDFIEETWDEYYFYKAIRTLEYMLREL